MSQKALSKNRITAIVYTLLFLFPLVGMGIDLIAPSLPAIAHDADISFTTSKNLISIYLIGFGCGTLILGFFSDTCSRRVVLLSGFLSFSIVSILPILFPNAIILLITRFFQGLTLCSLSVLARAVFSDILNEKKLLHALPMLATMWGLGPIIGPIIGGYLQYYFNWQACFIFYALFSLLGFIAIFFILPDTLIERQTFSMHQMLSNFFVISTHRLFFGLALVMGFTYSLLIIFNTLGPFFVQNLLHHSALYFGHLAFIMGIFFLLGTLTTRFFLRYYGTKELLQYCIPTSSFVALLGVGDHLLPNNHGYAVLITSAIMSFSCGILYPAALTQGMSFFRHLAGSASAIMGLITMIITAFTGFMISFMPITGLSINNLYLLMMILTCASYYLLVITPKESSK